MVRVYRDKGFPAVLEEEVWTAKYCSLEEARVSIAILKDTFRRAASMPRRVWMPVALWVQSDSLLFASLWNTLEYKIEEDEPDSELETEEDDTIPEREETSIEVRPDQREIDWLEEADTILNHVTPEKMKAYEWIEGGMQRFR
jgi:hypothetical protein